MQVIFILEINLEKVHFLAKYIHFSATNVFFNPCYEEYAYVCHNMRTEKEEIYGK